ncbi:hypothetical protein ACQ7HM_21040 [Williamsia sp. MIQD14]|uniref:hypothetical protein n=1 Tax=Williamsia sp. MIQD14 TaxID=3425703 RepID=UPI003DA01FA4
MSDDRWGWVTAPATSKPQPPADGVEQKQHFTNTPVAGAGRDALDLWAPAPAPPAAAVPPATPGVVNEAADATPTLAYSAVDDRPAPVEVNGHGPGDDAPTAQWPVAEHHNWTDQWQPTAGDGLDQLVVDGRAKKARTRSLRRAGIVAGFLSVVVAVVVVGAVEILPGDDAAPPAGAPAAKTAPAGWCPTGINGDTTTVATGGDQKTPTGAVAAFLSGLIDARSAAAARATMSPAAVAPTLDQLQAFVTGLPAATNGWCAQITTTDSAARVLVTLRLHVGDNPLDTGSATTFYVSASSPTSWSIDAIVSDEGSQP